MTEINKDLIAASSTPIVLAILAEEDSYGYATLQRVRELSGGRMEWTDGMLYPVLHRPEQLGPVDARRGARGVGGWDALPRWAPARAARPRRGAVGSCGERSSSQVLPDHVPGPGSARGGTPPVASGGGYATGPLAGGLPSPR